uniref:Methyltransferase domain protein n=1 Tax=Pithovirus LCPAC404 TaxID=2506597 RepID=A0A481ZBR9_9VIRU|nr:MAG: methyltransferase domain protein [Pithovirus LCPAC404]
MNYQEHIEKSLENALKQKSNITDEILLMQGMSGRYTRHFYNNICAMEDARYLEIGTWKGSSICAAMCNNKMKCVCIDNWTQFGNVKDEFIHNFNKFKGENDATFIEQDCWTINAKELGMFNIYMYDAAHTEESQYKAINHYLDCLDDKFIYLVDDWNHHPTRIGTLKAIEDNDLETCWKKEIYTNCNPGVQGGGRFNGWHNGLAIFILKKNVSVD